MKNLNIINDNPNLVIEMGPIREGNTEYLVYYDKGRNHHRCWFEHQMGGQSFTTAVSVSENKETTYNLTKGYANGYDDCYNDFVLNKDPEPDPKLIDVIRIWKNKFTNNIHVTIKSIPFWLRRHSVIIGLGVAFAGLGVAIAEL